MNYKETLFFVAKCLTISLEEKNKQEIELQLQNDEVDWEAVVKVSTAHYVLPAMYCNLKRADFLHYLPEDLVEFMQHITDLNRERNEQIIEQATEINQLLLDNNITPIFLKGTGNLLEELYEDHAERMVGDIDFIISKSDYIKTIKILKIDKYSKVNKYNYTLPEFKHYSKLHKANRIAAVEIHKELLIEKYADEFNFKIIEKDYQEINGIKVLSFENQLSLSIIAKQINDGGFHYKNIALRNAYDVFLLSKKTVAKNAFSKFINLINPLNCFLAICFTTFGEPNSLKFIQTDQAKNYLNLYNEYLINDKKRIFKTKIKTKELLIKKIGFTINKLLFNRQFRTWIIQRVMNKNWQNQKLIQLGIKKPKSNS